MIRLRRTSPLKPTVNFPTFLAVLTTGTCVMLAANAQVSPTVPAAEVSITTVGELLAGTPISTTEIPSTNTFQPTAAWPAPENVSATAIAVPHDLLAFKGVEASARQLVGNDFDVWRSHFAKGMETEILQQGLIMSSGCLSPCDNQKSMLVVDPTTQKTYAAMVTSGKVAMWPSLMSWPDESIPALRRWLAMATDEK
ncbi:MAG: hypothetical protein EON60_04345 [Alphaproteobacteria bacterium]|nr:MAG: hypothetical protein EON60_04345 [Alphaproteobacteria bacterium]